MDIKTSMIVSGKQTDSQLLKTITNKPDSNDKRLEIRTDIKKEVRKLLVKHNLSLEDIIIKYKEIYDGKLENTKVSDIVKVLENLEKLHGLHTKDESIDEITLTLSTKSPEELEDYLSSTLLKTKEVLSRLQARRINKSNSG
jgi:hypothetical protein